MNHQVLLLKDNWTFFFDDKKVSIKYFNVTIADNNTDLQDLVRQVKIYQCRKQQNNEDKCLAKIYNTNTNTTIMVKSHELLQLHNFLVSIKKNIILINSYTSSDCFSTQLN